jgi:membrane protease YdiL (CAAX protease family)
LSRQRRLPPAARAAAWVGGALFWGVLLGFAVVADLPAIDAILLSVLLVGVPVFSIAQVPLLRDALVERLPAYWSSIATLWLLGGASWLVGTRLGGAQALGLVGLPPVRFVLWTSGLTIAGLAIILMFREVAVWIGATETTTLRELIPRTRQEKAVFALLSIAAGVSEELSYRGYAIPMLTPLLGVGGAAAVTSVVFGVLHGYQGLLGTVRTALMGGALAWGFLTCGSIWPAIVAHALIDLAAGIFLGERLLPPEAPRGVSEADPRDRN